MGRRRVLSFSDYARRKWRAVGLTLVLMAGTFLYLTITDRGHEPVWAEREPAVGQVAASPDGRVVLATVLDEDHVSGLRAYRVTTGSLLWEADVNLTAPASVAAGDGWFALVSPFPRARLLAVDALTGRAIVNDFLAGEPRAAVADGRFLVVALRTGNVTVYEDLNESFTLPVRGLVTSVHAAAGRIAIGTTDGIVRVMEREREILNVTTRLQVDALRLSRDGGHLFVAGASLGDAAFGGGVTAFHLNGDAPATPVWHHATTARVGLVDAGDAGRVLVAVEETLPEYTLHGWNTDSRGVPAWSKRLNGAVFRENGGLGGGLDVSPDGRFVAVATTLGGPVQLVSGATGDAHWSFTAGGASSLAFPENVADGRFAANARLVPARPSYDHVLLFDAAHEPLSARWPWFPVGLVVLEALGGAAAVAAGYWWHRRS